MPKEIRIDERQLLKAIRSGKGVTFNDRQSAYDYAGEKMNEGEVWYVAHLKTQNKWIVFKIAEWDKKGEGINILNKDEDLRSY
jgi:hypothetical protein